MEVTITYVSGTLTGDETKRVEQGVEFAVTTFPYANPGAYLKEWNTDPNGDGASYRPGDPISINNDTTLYAIWRALPKLEAFHLRRVDAGGIEDEMGCFLEARVTCCYSYYESPYPTSPPASFLFSYGDIETLYEATPDDGWGCGWVRLDCDIRADADYSVSVTVTDACGYQASASAASATRYRRPSLRAVAHRAEFGGELSDEGMFASVDVFWEISCIGSQKRPRRIAFETSEEVIEVTAFPDCADANGVIRGKTTLLSTFVKVDESLLIGCSPYARGYWRMPNPDDSFDADRAIRAEEPIYLPDFDYYTLASYDLEEEYPMVITIEDDVCSASVATVLDCVYLTMDILGDSFEYIATEDETPDPAKTYYLKVRFGTGKDDFIYEAYSGSELSGSPRFDGYLEKAGPKPGRGISFGAPCVKGGFDVHMPMYHYGEPLALMMHPVGSVYMSVLPTHPAELFGGGSWEQMDGYVLRAAKAGVTPDAAKTGGSDTVTLGVANLPAHAHSMQNHTHTIAHTHGTGDAGHTVWPTMLSGKIGRGSMPTGTASGKYAWMSTTAGGQNALSSRTATSGPSANASGGPSVASTGNAGGGAAFSNLPAYKNVYAWVRVA